MKKIISTLLIYFIPLINLIYGQEACSVSSQNIDLSYFDLSLEGNQPDYQIKMYFNIIRTDDTDGDGEGEGGYDPTRIPILISIIDEAYNQYGIFFNYVCENNYIDSDERIENGFSDAGMCTGWDEFLHGDGIDIFIIAGFPTGIAGSGGVANGIPGTFIVLRGRGGTDGNSVFENSTIVHELGHLFGLLHMFHGCTQNPLIWNTGECQENPNGYGCGGESLCPWSELDYSCEGGSIPDLNECAEYYVNENDNNGDIAGDYIPDTPPSHNLIEKHRPNIDCTHSDKDVYNYADGKPTSALIVDPKGNDYNPDYNNFMSYNPYKDCRDHFTPNQVTVMKNYLESNPILQSVKTSETEVCECTYDHVINVNGTMTISDLISSYNLDQEVLVNSQIIIDGTLIVDKNFTFSGTLFSMKDKSVIEIKKGKVVSFDNVDIMDCGKFWKEIKVESGSTLNISGNSYIENGLAAVNAQKGATIDIDHTTFNNNRIGLYLNSLGEGKRTDVSIANTTFTSDENYTSPSDEGPRPVCGIYVKGQSRVYLRTTESNKNYFSTLQNGILAENSSIKVSYSEFDDIKSVGYDNNKLLERKGYAVKILDGEGISSVSHNIINDCRYGVGGSGSGYLVVYDNEITANEQGVVGISLDRVRVKANVIEAAEKGIFINESENMHVYFSQIFDNYVTLTSDKNDAKAIDVQSTDNLDIYNNSIWINGNEAGILLNMANYTRLENNTIQVLGSSNTISNAISISASTDFEVTDNLLEDYTPGTDNNGVLCSSSDGEFLCNYPFYFDRGMHFLGNCDPSPLYGNNFNYNQRDLVLGIVDVINSSLGESWIGLQYEGGKGYGNMFYGDQKVRNSSEVTVISWSEFRVNSENGEEYMPDVIEAEGESWFFDLSTFDNMHLCGDDPGSDLPPKYNCANIIKRIMQIDTMSKIGECEKIVWMYRYYKKLIELKNKNLLLGDCLTFLNGRKDSVMVQLGNVAVGIDSIMLLQQNTSMLLQDLIEIDDRLMQLSNQNLVGSTEWDYVLVEYDQKSTEYQTAIISEKLNDIVKIDNVKNILNDINVVDSCLGKLKRTYNVKLNLLKSDTLTQSEMDYLKEVAEYCPDEYGESVFMARSILSLYENVRYPSMEECISANVEVRGERRIMLDNKMKVYPNPASEKIEIVIDISKEEEGEVEIMNIRGKVLFKEKVNKQNILFEVSLKDFDSGMYLVKYISSKGIRRVEKLVVSK